MHNLRMCVCMWRGGGGEGTIVQVKELKLLARLDEDKWSQASEL